MNTVGDVTNRAFLFISPRPQVRPHSAGNRSVQLADRVGSPGHLQPDHRHAKRFFGILRIDAPQAHQLFVGQTQLITQRPQVFFDQLGSESVVSGWHGCVSGEYGLRSDIAEGVFKRSARRLPSAGEQPPMGPKRTVAFVQVIIHRRRYRVL